MKNKRILLSYIHYPVSSGAYIKRALRRLGHDVKSVGPATGREVWGIEVEHEDVPNGGLDAVFEGWTPDMVLITDSAFQFHHPFYGDVPHAVYGVDGHVRNYRQPGVDKYFLAHHDGPCHPVQLADEYHLPCAYDPEYFTPSPIAWEDRAYDVAMVGVMYQKRVEIVNALRDAGLTVWAGMGALYEDYAAIYQNARISLCVSAAGDVAQRVFETAAMGCVVLSDECADFERLEFENGTHYLGFDTTGGAVALAQSVLNDKNAGAQLALAAQRWAQPHTWDARCEELLGVVFG